MSGDMSSTFGMLSDEAGIIPRVLNALFKKLDDEEIENCVRCSYIELYNEELRDLLAPDDGPKLKIYDDNSRKNHLTTMVQGMEERHIINATDGLKWLQEGSVKRQVAATKCNDLSSRSHSVFTITVHAKRKTEDGEDYLVTGKLNLVDLAGSENIQRSGAENKRATEAGLINKSLLTLGRVINALVDRSAHIPYRESKLTRLLQDSLGGRTKTCIIATVSPAKSNIEETLSTLEYAFRAKDIRNKPQLNALINKKMLLRDFSSEIERLKSELIATRQRNGVYLSTESYEEITAQNESRRILTEEQAAKIETLENNLRNKVQELFSLTSSFMGLKKEHEWTRAQLDETKEVLDQTDLVLAATRKNLAEEAHIRRAHQETEEKLTAVGGELLNTLHRTVQDVGGLHAKNKRKSDLQCLNRSTWSMSQAQVSGVTELVESRIEEFRRDQEEHINNVSERMHSFVREELEKMSSTQAFLDDNLAQFGESKSRLLEQKQGSKEEMDDVLEEIKVVRDNVKERVGESLQAIAGAAERIAEDVVSELSTFHSQLHESYRSLGIDFKALFEEVLRHMAAQKTECDKLRQKLEEASRIIVESNGTMSTRIQEVVEEERKQAAVERQNLLRQIGSLISSQAELQESRLAGKTALIQQTVVNSSKTFESDVAQFSEGMDAWNVKDTQILEDVAKSRDALKTKLKDEWTVSLPIFPFPLTLLTPPGRRQAQQLHPNHDQVRPRRDGPRGRRANEGPRRANERPRRLCHARQKTKRHAPRPARLVGPQPHHHRRDLVRQHLVPLQSHLHPRPASRLRNGPRHLAPPSHPRPARRRPPPPPRQPPRRHATHRPPRVLPHRRNPRQGRVPLPHVPPAHRSPRGPPRGYARRPDA